MYQFLLSLLNVVCEMAPYLLLRFLIAAVWHVFEPQKFYAKYLSRNNKGSATEEAIRAAVEGIGYTFKGRK